jgi:hypothetical protein
MNILMYTNNKRENLNVYRDARYKVIAYTNEKPNLLCTHRLTIWILMYKEESVTINKHKEEQCKP